MAGKGLAAHQKNASAWGATLGFTDESGFLMAPLVRRTLAPRGLTPRLFHRAAHRQKVSTAAAILVSPGQRHLRLYWESFPNGALDADAYADFVIGLRNEVHGPLIVLQDRAPFHHGEEIEQATLDGRGLLIEEFPPYAPELNPPEFLWKHLKAEQLANFVPHDIPDLADTLHRKLWDIAQDQHRLRSFLANSGLAW